MSDEQKEETTPVEEEKAEESCLPCQALDKLCSILPEEDGRKVCEQIKIGLENDTMDANEAREMLASKVGRHVLATKLAEVSDWITEQELKRKENQEKLRETIPLEEEPKEEIGEPLPPPPEELTKPLDEIAEPIIEEPIVDEEEEEFYDFRPKRKKDGFYEDLEETDIDDDPAYMYDDTDVWIQEGVYDEDE